MTSNNIEIRKRYTNPRPKSWGKRLFWREIGGTVPKVDGFDYYINGKQVAASYWDGQRLTTVISPEHDGLFGQRA